MAKGGAGFINFHEKRKQYWAEYTWKDHIQFSTACCKNTLGSESMLLHGRYADRYAAAYDDMVEIQQTGSDHQKCHTKDIKILETEELEARELITNTWDMEAALYAWHAEDMFETVGLRPLGDDMVDEIRDIVAKVVKACQGNRQEEWITWKSRFEEVCSMEDGKGRRMKQWALLKATPGTEDEPGLWQSWLSEFRFKTRLRMKLGRTRELYRDSVHLLASQILTLVGDGKWDTPECERLRLFLCRGIQDLSDIEFRQRLRTNTAPPAFSDSDYMELEQSYRKLKKIPSLIEKLSGISLLHNFLDGCLDDVPWDRICEGYVWHWIEFIMKLKPDVYVLGFSVVSNVDLETLRRFTTGFELFQGTYLQEFMNACRPQLDGLPTANSMPVNGAANPAPQAEGKRKVKRKRKQTKEALEKTKVESSVEPQAENMLVAAPKLASDTNSGLVETAGDRQSDAGLAPRSEQQQTTTKDNTLASGNIKKAGGMEGEEALPALGPIEGEAQQHGEDPELSNSCDTLRQLKSCDGYLTSSPPLFTHENPVIGCYQVLREFAPCGEDKTVQSCQIIPCSVHLSTLVLERETEGNMSGVAKRLCSTGLETGTSERGEYRVINEPGLSVMADGLVSLGCSEERNATVQCGENAKLKQPEEVIHMPAESGMAPKLTAAGSVGQLEQFSVPLALEEPTNDVNPGRALQLSCSGWGAIEELDFDQESLLAKDCYTASAQGKKPASELKKIREGSLGDTAVGATLTEGEKIICRGEDLKYYNTSSGMDQEIIRSNSLSSRAWGGRVTAPTTSIDLTPHRISGKQTKITSKEDQEQKNASPQESACRLGQTNSSIDPPNAVKPNSRNVSNLFTEIAKDKSIMENGLVMAEESTHSVQFSGTENGSWLVVKEKRKGKKKASTATKLPEESPACEDKKRSSHTFLLPSSSVQPHFGRRLKNDPNQTAANVGNGPKPVQLSSEPTPTPGPIARVAVVNLTPKRTAELPMRSDSQPKSRKASVTLSANRAVLVTPTKKHQDERTVSQKTHIVGYKVANKPINRPSESHHRTRPLSLPGSGCAVRMVGDEKKSSSRGRTIWSDSHVALKSLFGGGVEDPVLQEEGLSNKSSSTCQQTTPLAEPGSMNCINPATISSAKLAILDTGSDGADTPAPYSLILKRSSAQRVNPKERGQTILQQDTEQPGTLEAMASTKVAIGVEGKDPTKSPEFMGVTGENDERSSFGGAKTTPTNGGYSRTKLVDNNDCLDGDRQSMNEENMLRVYKRLAREDVAALSAENNKLRDLILKLIDGSADERRTAMIADYRAIEFVKLRSRPSQDREKLYQHRREKDQPSDKLSHSTLDRLTVAEDGEPENGPIVLSLPKDGPKPSSERPEAYSIKFQPRRIPKWKDKRKGRDTRETQPKLTHILQREAHISSNIKANPLPGVKAQPPGDLSYRSSKKTSRLKTPIPNTVAHFDLASRGFPPGLNVPPRSVAENQLAEIPTLMTAPDGQPIYTSGHFRGPLVVPGLRFERFSETVSFRAPPF